VQSEASQQVMDYFKGRLKKDEEKACLSGKRCYFCTRNNGEVHEQYWRNADREKGLKFL